jgi:hypothetical protein
MSVSVTENAILRAAHFPKEREGAGGVILVRREERREW